MISFVSRPKKNVGNAAAQNRSDHAEQSVHDPESINSSLGIAPVLRSHILAFVAERFLNTTESIGKFMEGSLYGKQFGNREYMKMVIGKILTDLERWEFVESMGDIYKATRLRAHQRAIRRPAFRAHDARRDEEGRDPVRHTAHALQHSRDEASRPRRPGGREERYSAYIAVVARCPSIPTTT